MNLFESKYTLGIALGLICFQMYIAKNTSYVAEFSSRSTASISCKAIDNLDQLDEKTEGLCYLYVTKDENVDGRHLLIIAKRDKEDSPFKATEPIEIKDAQNNLILNEKVSKKVKALFNKDNLFTVVQEETPEVPAKKEEKKTEKVAEEDTTEVEEVSFTRAEISKILSKYKTTLSKVNRNYKNCSLRDKEIFSEAEELYADLKDAVDVDEKKLLTKSDFCDDSKCTDGLDEEQTELLVALEEELENLEDEDLVDDSEDEDLSIKECKAERLADEGFLEDYKCGKKTFTSRERFTRPSSESSTSKNPALSTKQICYYEKEILPGIRKALSTGNRDAFDAEVEYMESISQAIDTGSTSNEAIQTSLYAEQNVATYVRTYEDQLYDFEAQINRELPDVPAETKKELIDTFKRERAQAFLNSQMQTQGLLASSNALPDEERLLLRDNGAFDYWGSKLSEVNRGQLGLQNGYLNDKMALMTMSNLDKTTKEKFSSGLESEFDNFRTDQEKALARLTGQDIKKDPGYQQADAASKPIVSDSDLRRTGVKSRRQSNVPTDLFDLRHFRMATNDAPSVREKPALGECFSSDPSVSCMVPGQVHRGRQSSRFDTNNRLNNRDRSRATSYNPRGIR